MKLSTAQAILLLAFSWTGTTVAAKQSARQLKGGKKSSSSRGKYVRAGEPATFEFLITNNDCLSFDRLDQGKKAELQDCDDATEFIYRDDSLVQVYDSDKYDLCLDGSYSPPTLQKCDPYNEYQGWLFVRVLAKSRRTIYRLKNTGSGRFLEVEKKGRLTMAGGNDEAQWFVGPDSYFFEPTNYKY